MTKVIQTLRSHWKKSTFAAGILAYGVNYGLNELEINDNMRIVCEKAAQVGDMPAAKESKPKKVTVILNPAANKRKAKKNFENYCAPLLHLAGIYISVLETEREGHGRDIVTKLDPETDAVIVAGGDGTLSEVITGLMRHRGEQCQIPVGVLPLGKTNTLARQLFGSDLPTTSYNGMANAAMAVVRGQTKPIHAIRIELIQETTEEEEKPPVYGVAGVEWGLWRELKRRQDRFWYLGPLRKYATLVFHGDTYEQEVAARIKYTKPCAGCSKCYSQRPDLQPQFPQPVGPSKWWNFLSLKNRRLQSKDMSWIDYSKIDNPECSEVEEMQVNSSDLSVLTSNHPGLSSEDHRPHVLLSIAPLVRTQGEVLFDGVKAFNESKPVASEIKAKQLEIRPDVKSDEENLSIDNEDYELRPIRVTVLPNSIKVFCL